MKGSEDMNYDVLIRGGLIVDGSGKPGYLGDVAVWDGKIAYARCV